MEASNEVIIGLSGLLLGMLLGVLLQRLLGKGHRETRRLKHKLLESERKVSEMKDRLQRHLVDVRQHTLHLHRELSALDQKLTSHARAWHLEDQHLGSPSDSTSPDLADAKPDTHKRKTGQTSVDRTARSEATDNEEHPPRDYAEGNRGTLSEGFGLKSAQDASANPPRH